MRSTLLSVSINFLLLCDRMDQIYATHKEIPPGAFSFNFQYTQLYSVHVHKCHLTKLGFDSVVSSTKKHCWVSLKISDFGFSLDSGSAIIIYIFLKCILHKFYHKSDFSRKGNAKNSLGFHLHYFP